MIETWGTIFSEDSFDLKSYFYRCHIKSGPSFLFLKFIYVIT